MAGSGRKVFTAGEVLRAADVNGYLMDQSVQVYAGTAARGSAIGTATSAGMMSYLSDQSKLQLATGTATWVDVYPQSPFSPNFIINGAFDVWQRGASFTVGTGYPYTADRWQVIRVGAVAGMTVSKQNAVNTGFNYCLRAQRDSGNTSTAALQVWQTIETVNSIPLAGQSVTVSFYARSGANYSATGGAFTASLYSGTGTDQNVNIGGFTGSATVATSTVTLTTSWQRFTFSGSVGTTATEIGLLFSSTPVGTASTNDYFEITGVQLEVGSATTFRRNGNSIQGELAACQRYYYRIGSTAAYSNLLLGMQQSTTESHCTVQPPVTMRVTPSASGTTLAWSDVASFNTAISAISVSTTSVYSTFNLYSTYSASGAQYRPGFIRSGASAGYIELSAEL